jgi:hypothetical protein
MFLSLARVTNSNKKSSAVCDPDCKRLDSEDDRKNYISRYYEDFYYSRPEHEPSVFQNCAEDFLGPDVFSTPIVQSSNYPLPSAETWSARLQIVDELDKSINQANMNWPP